MNDLENVASRVRWSLHYLDHNPDPTQGWMPFFGGVVSGPVSYSSHSAWDACDMGWRAVEAYLLARQVLGQRPPGAAEEKLRAFVLSTLCEDGLSYRPERSWCEPEAWMWDHGRALIALSTWMRLEPSAEVAQIARRMAEGLARIAVREGDAWVYPAENWTGSAWGDTVLAHPPTGLTIEGLVDLAELLDDARLLEMAGHFVCAVRTREPLLFDGDGALVPMGGGPYDFYFTHLHARLGILLGTCKYALAQRDDGLRDWCVRAYRHVRDELSTSSGWVPESLEAGTDPGVRSLSSKRRDEVCSISDMMQIAALLAGNGWTEELLTVGRYGTNRLFAHQLLDLEPLAHLMGDERGGAVPSKEDPEQISTEGMPERTLGGFVPGSYPNDLAVDVRSFGMGEFQVETGGCCSPAGIKALYVLWHEAVRREADRVHLTIWASVENDDLEVRCEEPSAGELHITVKRPCGDLVVHVPEYVDAADVRVSPEHDLRGDCVHLGPMQGGERVTLTYPLSERVEEQQVAGAEYRYHWRGGRVLSVSPPGAGCAPYWWRYYHRKVAKDAKI